MRYSKPSSILKTLLLASATAAPSQGRSLTDSYTDADTGITFHGYASPPSYLFGMVLPQQPTTDLIVQLVSPLTEGGGWGGVSFGSSMTGPLLLVTWPSGDKVMTATRVANEATVAGVVPYTANPITLSPIRQGTFVNSSHVSSTFLCGGCINGGSFDPAWPDSTDRAVYFGYAFAQTAVEGPSNINTGLSDHTGRGGGYGAFKVVLSDAKSKEYDTYAAMAGAEEEGDDDNHGVTPEQPPDVSATSQTTPPTLTTETGIYSTTKTPEATPTDNDWRDGCWESECEMPNGTDFSHREMSHVEFFALLVLGVAYLGQAFLA